MQAGCSISIERKNLVDDEFLKNIANQKKIAKFTHPNL